MSGNNRFLVKSRPRSRFADSNRVLVQCRDVDPDYFVAHLNTNCNSNATNVNPEFGANEPGCGCTFSYNGGAGAGTAAPCCDSTKPYEQGFADKKRDPTCCCESGRCYERTSINKEPKNGCVYDFKYVPEFNQPPPPCPPLDCATAGKCGCDTYQGGLANKKPESCKDCNCGPEGPPTRSTCTTGQTNCCNPDTYELIANKDAQRYKGKGPDRSNFYASDDCCPCQQSNNASTNNSLFEDDTDWSEIRRQAYASTERCASISPKLVRRTPSFYCEEEHYVKEIVRRI
ncbi:collectin-11 [Plakobranchus ocellatus]|uniref:Collectin-11 n=1 Tax=Plakobranchus ocellatus TaxID=259542 RepID=A0AAV4DJ54_9GAST|nr:collectin-11 [Plakobranchus ocellatus]